MGDGRIFLKNRRASAILLYPYMCNKTNVTQTLLFMARICAYQCIILHVKKCCHYLNIRELETKRKWVHELLTTILCSYPDTGQSENDKKLKILFNKLVVHNTILSENGLYVFQKRTVVYLKGTVSWDILNKFWQ